MIKIYFPHHAILFSFCLFFNHPVELQNSLLYPLNMLKNHLLAQIRSPQILLNISIGTYSFMKTIYPVLYSGLQLNMQIITSFHISPQAGASYDNEARTEGYYIQLNVSLSN